MSVHIIDLATKWGLIAGAGALFIRAFVHICRHKARWVRVIMAAQLPPLAAWLWFYIRSLNSALFPEALPFAVWLSRMSVGITLAAFLLIQQVVSQIELAHEELS